MKRILRALAVFFLLMGLCLEVRGQVSQTRSDSEDNDKHDKKNNDDQHIILPQQNRKNPEDESGLTEEEGQIIDEYFDDNQMVHRSPRGAYSTDMHTFLTSAHIPSTIKPFELDQIIQAITGGSATPVNHEKKDEKILWGVELDYDSLPQTKDEAEFEGAETALVVDHAGIEWDCLIPDLVNVAKQERDFVKNAPTPDVLLKLIEDVCFYRWTGWWVYELCPGRFIRQYHQDTQQDPVSKKTTVVPGSLVEYYLGFRGDGKMKASLSKATNFDSNLAPENSQDEAGQEVDGFFVETYTGGTKCDLTNQPRTATVRYYCSPADINSGNQILEVAETSSCNYLVTVHFTDLCHHPHFAPKEAHRHVTLCRVKGSAESDKFDDLVVDADFEE